MGARACVYQRRFVAVRNTKSIFFRFANFVLYMRLVPFREIQAKQEFVDEEGGVGGGRGGGVKTVTQRAAARVPWM
jgi:hypothetical protein